MIRPMHILLLCLSCTLGCGNIARAEDLKEFIENLNSGWTNRNYNVVMSNINARLAVDSNDVLGLALKMNYYLWAELNTSNAHIAATSLSNVIHNSGRDDLYPLVDEMVTAVIAVNETNSYTSPQHDKLHTMFPNMFPSIIESVFLYSKLTETNAPPED